MLGENIKNARIDKGYSINDLARLSGVSKTVISDLEDGVKNSAMGTLEKLGLSLGISVRELLGKDKENANIDVNSKGRLNEELMKELEELREFKRKILEVVRRVD
jgi:transcriptional regulator with XRE-family HTH domain